MLYIFDGDDEFSRHEALAALEKHLSTDDMLSLNTTTFDGSKVGFEELRHACDSVPFFSDARLVIVEGLLSYWAAKSGRRSKRAESEDAPDSDEQPSEASPGFRDRLLEYLPQLPKETHLVLLEPSLLSGRDAFLRLLRECEGLGTRKPFTLPNVRRSKGREELAGWIRKRAKAKGAQVDGAAIAALADLIGNDLRQLDSELEKLATYAGDRAVGADDVRRLVSQARETVIWDLIGAINQKDLGAALEMLESLLNEGEQPLGILALIASQYRLLLPAFEMAQERTPVDAIASRLGKQTWQVERALRSARSATTTELRNIYRTLLEVDAAIKTGRQEADTALELLLAQLCRC